MRSDKNDLLPFFDLQQPSFNQKATLATSHFFSQLKALITPNFSIIHSRANESKILLGTITEKELSNLLNELSPNALIISCNEVQSGSAAIVTPVNWRDAGIEHYHFPHNREDNTTSLHRRTIEKMRQAWQDKRTIYIHGDSDPSQSNVIAVLFHCLVITPNAKPDAVLKTIQKSHSIRLSLREWEIISNVIASYTQLPILNESEETAKLEALSQSLAFKAFCQYAYTHPRSFDACRTVLIKFQENTSSILSKLSQPDEIKLEGTPLDDALDKIKEDPKGKELLDNLVQFLKNGNDPLYEKAVAAYQSLNHILLASHSANIPVSDTVRNLQASVILADATSEQKISQLNRITAFLTNPLANKTAFWNDAQAGLDSNNKTLNNVGKSLAALGCVLALFTAVITIGSGGSLLAPAIIIALALELTAIAIGFLLIKSCKNQDVTHYSESLCLELTSI